jgi:hypothetical protein
VCAPHAGSMRSLTLSGRLYLKSAPLFAVLCALSAIGLARGRDGFTRYSPASRSLEIAADFDGDGRPDSVEVRSEGGGRSVIEVALDGRTSIANVDEAITALVENDVDRDGDLDLVGETSSGKLLIWINDGEGRFVRETATARTPHVGGEAAVSTGGCRDTANLCVTVIAPVERRSAEVIDAVERVGRRPAPGLPCVVLGLLPSLRAPPAAAI